MNESNLYSLLFHDADIVSTTYDSKNDEFIYYTSDGSKYKVLKNGDIYLHNNEGKEVLHYYADGEFTYKIHDQNFLFHADGSCSNTDTHEDFSYEFLEDGSISISDNLGGNFRINTNGVLLNDTDLIEQEDIQEENKTMSETNLYSLLFHDADIVSIAYDSENNERIYYTSDGSKYQVLNNGDIYLYNNEGKEVLHYYADGEFTYKIHDQNFLFHTDGSVSNTDTHEDFSYEFLEDGSISISDNSGDNLHINTNGVLLGEKKDGVEYIYDWDMSKQGVIQENGKISYSRINHIDYDEDVYNSFLSQLISINGMSSDILGLIEDNNDVISSFPDAYSPNVSSKNNLSDNFELISSLIEMTNYSLLAYKSCDEYLEGLLKELIDSLFEDADLECGNLFKDSIKDTIEDNDKDGILEYKSDTNFNKIISNDLMIEYLEKEYNIKFMESGDVNEKLRYELSIPSDAECLVAKGIMNVNGVEFPSYYVFDSNEISHYGEDMMNLAERHIAHFSESYTNVEHLEALKEFGTEYVFDQTPKMDSASSDDNSFYGSGWCAFDNTIKVHYWPGDYTDDADVFGILTHETGHATDNLRTDDTNTYKGQISTTYADGKILFLKEFREDDPNYNDGYVRVEYDEGNNPYVIVNNETISLDPKELTLEVDGVKYVATTEGDVQSHCCEVAAEVTRRYYEDEGYLISKMEEDPSYKFVADDILSYLSDNFGSDISAFY